MGYFRGKIDVSYKKIIKKFIKYIILIVIIYYFIFYVFVNWNKIDEYKYETDWFYLSISILLLLVSFYFLPLSLRNIVGIFKCKISFKKICIILFYSQFAKYLPGGVWGYVGRVYLYKKEGMSAGDASKSVLLETLLVLVSGIFISFGSLFFIDKLPSPGWIDNIYIRSGGLLISIVLIIIMHPKILNSLLGMMPTIIIKNKVRFDYDYLSLLKPTLYLVIFWLGVGISFWFLIRSFIYVDSGLLPMTTCAFIISWVIGLFVFFTPGGIGTREAVLIVLLNLHLPVYISAFIAVMARIWWVMGEIIWLFLSYTMNRFGAEAKKNKVAELITQNSQ